ncbi:hypothetical protein [Lysobacter gummosus]
MSVRAMECVVVRVRHGCGIREGRGGQGCGTGMEMGQGWPG